jgi:HSP20 family protein
MSSPFDEWFGRRRRFGSWFPDVDEMMRDVEKMMQEAFKNVEQQVPKNLVKERKLDDGSVVREMGPIVYGYSVKVGPDGKPVVRKFGNIDAFPNILGGNLTVKEEREPLVDIIKSPDELRVVAEVPGVNKEDLRLRADENSLTIESVTKELSCRKQLTRLQPSPLIRTGYWKYPLSSRARAAVACQSTSNKNNNIILVRQK